MRKVTNTFICDKCGEEAESVNVPIDPLSVNEIRLTSGPSKEVWFYEVCISCFCDIQEMLDKEEK